ncbi:sugar kinase [Leifsonia sp. 21MFCrub1.1]|uniref:sugar kinase n=1 Tax=Leifsonia sp. 21MFCrub1.1 TaxID=1798223 RepID=UPI000892A538|nr:sugar kinase [Leifsonia sp. 21MFCrub1.1]SEB09863.1 2-dehydro-3-deoxygluconokinase [Leifsonia sp. 21MFCrub1.1]
MSTVVTIGETLALMSGTLGPLQHSPGMTLGMGGSESNVAIGLARLGVDATWIGKVGADALGDLVVREIAAEGVRVVATRDPDAPTALMIKERRTALETRVYYYRAGSAGSRLTVQEVDFDLVRSASLLHVTGISLALSPSVAEVIGEAVRIAKAAGVIVSFDLNFRSKLWSRERAAAAYQRILPHVDIAFGGADEAVIALGGDGPPLQLAHGLIELGARSAVVKLGAAGAVAFVGGQDYEQAAVAIAAVDTVGAGDAFVAGYLAEVMAGEPPAIRLATAVTAGAYACLAPGDWEGLPRRSELAGLSNAEPVTR